MPQADASPIIACPVERLGRAFGLSAASHDKLDAETLRLKRPYAEPLLTEMEHLTEFMDGLQDAASIERASSAAGAMFQLMVVAFDFDNLITFVPAEQWVKLGLPLTPSMSVTARALPETDVKSEVLEVMADLPPRARIGAIENEMLLQHGRAARLVRAAVTSLAAAGRIVKEHDLRWLGSDPFLYSLA